MPWFKVDDAFHGHPKVMELSPAAVGIWTLAGTWCANYLTDGEIKHAVVSRLGGTPEMIQELIDSGLWIKNGNTYQFKDWEDYQPVKADVEAERDAARERMRANRAKKKGVDRSGEHTTNDTVNTSERSGDVRANTERSSHEVRVTPTQSQPDPVPAQPERSKERSTRPRNPRDTDDQFERFWKAFPSDRKDNKPGCRKKFASAVKDGVDPEYIIAAAAKYRDDPNRESHYTVNPHRWLNEARWDSSPLPERPNADKPSTSDKMRNTLALGQQMQQQALGAS